MNKAYGDPAHWLAMAALMAMMWIPSGVFAKEAVPEKLLVRTVEVDGAKLEFTAQPVQAAEGERKVSQGMAIYRGELWRGGFSPPWMVMKSGVCEIDGKKVALDVSGLADPWVGEDRLEKRFVKLETSRSEGQPPMHHLTVIFAKGGALDFQVEWEIFEGKSIRVAVKDVGDAYPEWVKAK